MAPVKIRHRKCKPVSKIAESEVFADIGFFPITSIHMFYEIFGRSKKTSFLRKLYGATFGGTSENRGANLPKMTQNA